ncbi:class I lanthipeptide [Longitalea luteola]|uniref:class I lanthipeptide n=1 Tax=Longitalea luteola TaxID=2812563 RepID=UPI001A961F49|nr:class I lanthipeptide [Longitalea luteola]
MKKKKINLGTKLSLSKEKLSKLNEEQLNHFLGGRMAVATDYTSNGNGKCSEGSTSCCSIDATSCCG